MSIDPSMLWPLLGSALGFTLLFGAIVLMRMRAELARNKVEARMKRMAAQCQMNPWPFIIGAYAAALLGTAGGDAVEPRRHAPIRARGRETGARA